MVRVTFYGPLADIAGRERSVDLGAERMTARALLDGLAEKDGALAAALAATRVKLAVNDTIVADGAPIRDGDDIAVLPPFSGG